jgi:hypothetical protein
LEAIKADLCPDKLALLTASCLHDEEWPNDLAIYIKVDPKEALSAALVLDLAWYIVYFW